MNKRDAIRMCKKKYRYFIKRNDTKFFPPEINYELHAMIHQCPLCQYVLDQTKETPYTNMRGTCNKCPLVVQFGKNCRYLGWKSDWKRFAEKFIFKLTGDR